MFAEQKPRSIEVTRDHSHNPASESQGGFSELSVCAENPHQLHKRIKDLWTMQDRYTARYTEQEFSFFVTDVLHLLSDPRNGLAPFLPPTMNATWDPSLAESRGAIEMSIITGE